MKGLHKWAPKRQFDGMYTSPQTGRSFRTCMHDVECKECGEVVTLPVSDLPENLEGCPGKAARPVRETLPIAEEFKDEPAQDDYQGSRNKNGGKGQKHGKQKDQQKSHGNCAYA